MIVRRLSYANVVSTLCLFLILGGGAAFAAFHLPAESVGARQLKKGAVTGAKIRRGAITGQKVDVATLPTVPTAATASVALQADNAAQANTAAQANVATTAGALSGLPASAFERRTMWVLVSRGGTIVEGSGGISVASHPFPSAYLLRFPEPVTGKAVIASTSAAENGPSDAVVQATPCGGGAVGASVHCHGSNTDSEVLVETFAGGTEEEATFYLAVLP